jgi:hypothetical protein
VHPVRAHRVIRLDTCLVVKFPGRGEEPVKRRNGAQLLLNVVLARTACLRRRARRTHAAAPGTCRVRSARVTRSESVAGAREEQRRARSIVSAAFSTAARAAHAARAPRASSPGFLSGCSRSARPWYAFFISACVAVAARPSASYSVGIARTR